jgi:uncharacterized cupin superfamily protein
MANVFDPEWDAEQDRGPFRWRRSRLGLQAGSRKLGASLFELEPGAASFPLHIHYANEELLIVIEGRPTLRQLDGERVLEPGEVVALPAGRSGAHRIDNRSAGVARVLVVSTMLAPEVNEYPDSDKIWVRDVAPGTVDPPVAELDTIVSAEHPLADYFEGEPGV